jgi:spore germination cell wall hydrolase CwlJ-like protein
MANSFYEDQVRRNRLYAQSLLAQGSDTSPVGHPLAAVARAVQGAMGGYIDYKDDERDKANQSEANQMMAKLLMGNQQPSAPAMPSSNAGANPMGAMPSLQSTAQKIYSNDEPSPLDPPSGADRDRAIRTVVAEAGNQGPTGMNAVASVIRNRATLGNYGGDTPSGVVMAPKQFEPWNDMSGRSRMASIDPNSSQFQQAAKALDSAYFGNDPTNGATNFYAPKAQAALGRPAPAWDNGKGVDIGDHRFFGGAQQAPTQMAQAAPQGNSPQAVAQMLQSKNPQVQRMGQQLAQQHIAAQMGAQKPTDEIKEFEYAQRNPAFKDYKIEQKKAGAIQNQVVIDQKGETAFSTEAGKVQAKRFDELASEGPKAKQMISDVQTLTELGKQIGTGKEAQVKAALGPYADAIGVKIDGLNEIQAFESIVARVAPNLRVPGSGAQSDYELKNFLKSIPSIGNTDGGNKLVAKTMEGLYQNKMAAAEIGAKALSGEISRTQAEKMLRELPDPMKEWREVQKTMKAAPQAAPDRAAIEQEMRRRGLLK